MPTFTATLSDGREVEFEADQEPTHDELLAALSSWKEPSTEVPVTNEIPKIGQEYLTEQAAIGGRPEDWQMEASPGLGIKTALQIPGAAAQDLMNKLVKSGATPSAVRDAIRQQREPAFVPEPPTPIFERGGGLENVGAALRGEPFDSATTAAFKPLTERLPEGVRTGIEEYAKERGASATSPLSLATGGLATIPIAFLPKSVAESNPLTRPLAPKVGGGISKGILHIAEGFTSPVGLATLGMGSLPVAAQRAVSLAFAADMARTMPELATQLGDEFGKPPEERDNAKIAELLTSAVGTAAFTTLAAKHGLTPRKPAGPDIFLNQRDQPTIPGDFRAIEQPTTGVPNASRIQETTAVHGDLRAQPVEGQRQVPAEEGGGGVQSRAEAGAEAGQQRVLLSEEHQKYLDEERKAIDVPIEIVPEIPEGHPFAGLVASIDPATGRILINPERYKSWLDSIPADRRRQAVRSMLSEERIHLATPPDAARSYGATLTAAEKAITQRIYGGKHWRQNPLNDLQLGHEALRYRMQQLTRMTPREAAEAALRERWTVQGLDIVARTIQGTREALGTKASKEGLAILGQIEKNLGIAQAAIASGSGTQPGVTLKERVDKAEEGERKGLITKPTKLPVTVEGPDGKTYQATFDGVQDWSSIGRGKLNQVTLLEEIPGVSPQHGTTYAESLSKKGYTVKGIPEEAPGVRQKKGREDTSEQQFMFLPPVPKGAGIERPTAVESGAEAITPAKVSAAAVQHLTEYAKPSFNEFVRETKRRFGDVQPGQLRDAWEDAAWKRVTNATGPELEVMRESLKLSRNYGRREVAGTQEVTPPPSLKGLNREARKRAEEARRITTSRQNYRKSVQSAIARKLIEQSYEGESLKKALGRRELTADDLATNRPKMFEEISAEDAASPERLSRIILENFRASSSLPETNTRRVVALVNRKTGQTSLVSVYNHPRTGAMIVNPASSTSLRPNVPLASVLKDYRAIATALLDEPVKNFSQRFGSVSEYNAKFADDARNAVQAQASYEASLGETAGIIEPEGPQGPIRERPLTDAEAGALLDHFYNANEGIPIESKENVRIAMNDVADLADLGEKPHTVFAAYLKLYERIREDHPDLSEGEAIDRMADQIYEDNKASKTREDFVARTMGRYQGQAREAVQAGKPATATGARELTKPESPPISTVPEIPVGYPNPYPGAEPNRVYLAEGKGLNVPKLYTPPLPRPAGKPVLLPEGGGVFYRQRPETLPAPSPTGVPEAARGTLPPRDAPGMLVKDAREKVSFAKRMVTDPAKGFARWYSEWMSNAVRSQGGPNAAHAANIADAIVDRAKLLYGRDLTPTLDPAKELAGGAPRRPIIGQVPYPSLISANKWLNEMDHPVSERTGVANVVGAIEGTKPVPASAQRTVDAAKAANLEAGRLVQPVTPGFVATGKFQRNLTGFGYDIITEGPTSTKPTDLWNIYTRDTAILNHADLNAARAAAGQPPLNVRQAIRETRKFFMDWRNELRDPAPDANRLERINQDYSRFYPKAITHVRTASGWQEMMHTTLFNYLENVAQRAAHARAFREQFPNNAAGKLAFAQLDSGVRGELPATSIPYWDSLVKTIQGRPTDTYAKAGFLRPGQPWGEFLKGLNQTAMSSLKRLALTGQMVTQLPETIFGSGLAELGMKNRLRSLAQLKQLWPEMEKQGQVNQLLYDWSYDPNAKIRSTFRMGNNLLSKVFMENFLNEFQGRLAAGIAKSAADRVRNQATEPLTAWEKRQYPETFRKMQFTPDQVNALMAGDPILLNVFERRAPAWLTTENRAATETSMAGNNRLLNSVFPFQMYPMNKMNQFRRNYLRLGEAWKSGDKDQRKAAVEGLGRFLFANTAQGAAYVALAAYAFGGKEGADIKKHEAMDEKFEFLAESLIATLGGPYYLLWQGARRNGVTGITEQGTRMLFPYTQAADLNDMLQGNGQYRDQDVTQRIGRYVQQKTPGFRIAKNALSIFGLGQDNNATEQAIKGLYRWKLDTYGPDTSHFDSPESRRVFRNKMRKAVDALKAGSLKDYEGALAEAQEASLDPTSVASSFRARKVLKNNAGAPLTDEEMDALTERIGEKAVERLKDYDAMLDWAAGQ